jgi:3-deoxy-D-manno-octulosonic-acid transferase
MSLFVYNLLLFLLSPLVLGLLLYRLSQGKEDKDRWGERWGKLPSAIGEDRRTPRFWVHAVSVGEVFAATPVLRELRKRYPDAYILLSTTTTGGREVAQKQMPPADEVVYYPLDFPFAVNRALELVRPDVVILMEWEIWPNFLTAAKRRGARIAVLNGRVSDKGLRRGLKARFFTAPGLAAVDRFLMQSDEDSRRAALVGANPAKVVTVGNTKFDESMKPLTDEERDALRADLGIPEGVPVWISGSTRDARKGDTPDEEVFVAEAARIVRERFPSLHLILAPRHLPRADDAAAALEKAGFTVARRSKRETGPTLLLDTFGELGKVYAVTDVAFIGGSLVRQGGQSVFQPLAQGVPAVFGPYMSNQRDIAALSKAEGVGFEVKDANGLAAEVIRLLSLSSDEKQDIAEKARSLIDRNQGVSARCVDEVARLLPTPVGKS